MEVLNYVKGMAAVVGCGCGFFFGGLDGILLTLVVLVCADYATGVMAAGIEGRISSEVGLKGICKKVMLFLLVGMANLVDNYVFQGAAPMREAVIFFYIANEAISILENAGKIGVPIPGVLERALIRLKDEKGDIDAGH